MVIGLTGANASGKGEVAQYLRSRDFIYHSLSDILREESKKMGIEPQRENLIRLGNQLRKQEGPAVLALRIIEKLSENKNHIVDSIRNPAEVEALRGVKGFLLFGIDAPVEVRFRRGLKRSRPGDALTLEDFIKKEGEENIPNAENQQLKKCLEMSDTVIVNNSSFEELYKKIDETLEKNKSR
ncbi:MAG: AAA family ATPase [Candidatus Omnitrophota bacterium]